MHKRSIQMGQYLCNRSFRKEEWKGRGGNKEIIEENLPVWKKDEGFNLKEPKYPAQWIKNNP